jgi:hypothetical protein
VSGIDVQIDDPFVSEINEPEVARAVASALALEGHSTDDVSVVLPMTRRSQI